MDILAKELLAKFLPPLVGEYYGSSDMKDCLYWFKNIVLVYQYTDGVKCHVF